MSNIKEYLYWGIYVVLCLVAIFMGDTSVIIFMFSGLILRIITSYLKERKAKRDSTNGTNNDNTAKQEDK